MQIPNIPVPTLSSATRALAYTLALAWTVSGCEKDAGKDVDPDTVPTVVSVSPTGGAADVARNVGVLVQFSIPMDGETFDAQRFTVESDAPAAVIAGTVVVQGDEASFWPTDFLPGQTLFHATVSTDVLSAGGVPLAEAYAWTFTTGDAIGPSAGVPLGAAEDFVILAKSGISTVPPSVITGDLGVSPAAASYLTGFSLSAHSSGERSTSDQVTGDLYAADDAEPTPTMLTTAVRDMETAYTDAAGRAAGVQELGAGNIGGLTLEPGVYRWSTGLLIPTDVTLAGDSDDVWIFQIAQDLTVDSGVQIVLSGGAAPENVVWQVAGAVDLGTTARFEGIVLAKTAVELRTGATVNGRIYAQTAVTLDASRVTEP